MLKPILVLLNLLLLIGFINWSIVKKEKTIKDGQLVLLSLAPVDPRSLMQGDYMRLRYAISESISRDSGIGKAAKRGYVALKLNDKNIGEFIRIQPTTTPLNKGEVLVKYFMPNGWDINIGAESYFFEEGTAEKYDTSAVYGGLRVDEVGNSVLIGLYDSIYTKL